MCNAGVARRDDADRYVREAEYYQKKAVGYRREASYFLKKAEICQWAAGAYHFIVPYKKLLPFMTQKAKRLIHN